MLQLTQQLNTQAANLQGKVPRAHQADCPGCRACTDDVPLFVMASATEKTGVSEAVAATALSWLHQSSEICDSCVGCMPRGGGGGGEALQGGGVALVAALPALNLPKQDPKPLPVGPCHHLRKAQLRPNSSAPGAATKGSADQGDVMCAPRCCVTQLTTELDCL